MRLDLGVVGRQRQHDDVERAAVQLLEQHLGLRLAQLDAQVRIAPLQHGQDLRQHIGRDRGDDAELHAAGQQPAAMAREIRQVAGRGQHALGALRHLGADVGQGDFARPPLDQRHAEVCLQLPDLHGERRLGHRAGLGGLAEMPVVRPAPTNNATVSM